jgi:hypothetical protein
LEPAYTRSRYEAPDYPARARHRNVPVHEPGGGADGNERLTAWTGLVLLLLLAAEGLTILSVGSLLTMHFFIGMVLLGPVAVKLGSTGYRFVRYYTGSAPYRRKGPPAPILRLLGPVIVAATVGVFGSGVALAFTGPVGRWPWVFLHKGSFVVWFCAMTVHVLWYAPQLPRILRARRTAVAGRGVRFSLLAASLVLGLVIAVMTVHLAGNWRMGVGG